MLEFFLSQATDPRILFMFFAAIATGATVLTLAMPLLTTDTLEQAEARANKGFDAAMTAIEMARFAISVAN